MLQIKRALNLRYAEHNIAAGGSNQSSTIAKSGEMSVDIIYQLEHALESGIMPLFTVCELISTNWPAQQNPLTGLVRHKTFALSAPA